MATKAFDLGAAIESATEEVAPERIVTRRPTVNPFTAPLQALIDGDHKNTRVGFGVTVPNGEVSRVKGIIGRAAQALNVSAMIASREDSKNGHTRLIVTVRDRITRTRKAK